MSWTGRRPRSNFELDAFELTEFPSGPRLRVNTRSRVVTRAPQFASISWSCQQPERSKRRHLQQRRPKHVACLVLAEAELQGTAEEVFHRGEEVGAATKQKLQRRILALPESVRRLLAGGIAGALSKTLTAPIETVRMQVMAGKAATAVEAIQRTWMRRGVLGFFSGNSADIIRVIPSKAIELAAFDLYKSLLTRHTSQKPGPLFTGLAGAAAGATASIGLYPLETIRTQLAMGEQRGIAAAVRHIIAEDGVLALYNGLDASLIGVLPYAALRLGLYDGFKWSYRKFTKQEHIPPGMSMTFGALSGLLSASATFPLEVVRRRMMMGTAKGNTFVAIASIYRSEGLQALFKGIALTWAKTAPQYAVTFLAYDSIKEMLQV